MESFHIDLAHHLTHALTDVLRDYEHELRLLDSPLVKDDASRDRCLAYAQRIVTDAAEEIRTGKPVPSRHELAREIGAAHAYSGIHPSESLRAANVLFSTALRSVARRPCPAATAEQATLAALTLHDVLVRALRPAADSYAGVLLSRVRQARFDERRRLSRELHDRIGHGISVAQRNLELYGVYRETEPARAAARLQIAQDLLDETIDRVREVIGDLRVVEPTESLEEATTIFLDLAAGPDLHSHVEVNGDEAWAPVDVTEETFLIIREALRNVVKHADARQVCVRIDIGPDELRACVVDDGRGFDTSDLRHGGTGVLSMRERAAMLGGTLNVTSRPGCGTDIRLWVPLNGAGEG
jgi:signal transduction histidine kinase